MCEKKFEWLDDTDKIGEHLFTFDGGKTVYNLFTDYPKSLTPEEKDIFDKENEYWVEFFKDRL